MPNSLVNKVSEVCNLPVDKVEHLWNRAKEVASEQGLTEKDPTMFYPQVVGIFKHMITKKCTKKLKWKFPSRWKGSDKYNARLERSRSHTVEITEMGDDYNPYTDMDYDGSSIIEPVNIGRGYRPAPNNQSWSSESFGTAIDVIHVSDTDVKASQQLTITTDDTKHIVPIDASFWLPLAAKHYNISPNLNDYLVQVVPGMVTDIPNTNGDSVSMGEMLEFSPTMGMPAFRTFKGKGCFVEHSSSDLTQAKGVILDVMLKPLKGFGGNHAKLIQLLAFDTTKDPELCRRIEREEINTYSIGILYKSCSCSICGKVMTPNDNTPCAHTYLRCRTYRGKDNRLVYRNCRDIYAYETSVVRDPAYVSAIGSRLG